MVHILALYAALPVLKPFQGGKSKMPFVLRLYCTHSEQVSEPTPARSYAFGITSYLLPLPKREG